MKKILYTLLISLFIIPTIAYAATINDSFDPDTCTLTLTGEFTGHDATVSIFDKSGEFKGMKTSEISGGKYSVMFVLTYDEDTKIDATVANENGSNDFTKENISVPACELNTSKRTIYSDNNDSLTILDSNGSFEDNDRLNVEYMFDFSNLDEDDQATLDAVLALLGKDKKLAGVMMLAVSGDRGEKEIPETEKGYQLFLNLDKDTLSKYTNPTMARILIDQDKLDLEDGIAMSYDEDKGGVTVKINNVGIYVLYEDLSKPAEEEQKEEEKPAENKPNPKTGDVIFKYVGLAAISGVGIIALKAKSKKKSN